MQPQPSRFDVPIDISKTLTEAWDLVTGIKLPVANLLFIQSLFTIAFYIIFAIMVVPRAMHLISQSPSFSPESLSSNSGLLSLETNISDQISQPIIRSLLFDPVFLVCALIFAILTPLFIAAEYLLGVKQVLGLKPTVNNVLSDCLRCLPQLVVIFFIFMFPWLFFYVLKPMPSLGDLAFLGIIFKILFYLGCILTTWACFAFAVPLVIIKRYPPILAAIESAAAVISYCRTLIILSLIMLVILTASIFTLGIFLIWAIPMMLNMHGIVFRDVFRNGSY